MGEINNMIIYAAWLKDKNRRSGEMILDCLHIAAGNNKTEENIKEYILKRIKETPAQFSIGDLSLDNIIVEIIRLATVERGHTDIETID